MTRPEDRHEIRKLKADLTFQLQQRRRPDRHPYQIGCQIGMICVAISQMILGLPPESALWNAIDHSTLVIMNTTFIIGCVMSLVGAALDRSHRFELSVHLGMIGQFTICVATTFYVIAVFSITEAPYWLSVLSAGVGGGIGYAAVHRMVDQWKLLRAYNHRNAVNNEVAQ